MNASKMPPHSEQIEKAILCTIIIKTAFVGLALALLEDDDFYTSKNKKCFQLIVKTIEKGNPYDAITLAQEMGDYPYISGLSSDIAAPSMLENHCLRLIEFTKRRKLIETSTEIISACYQDHATPDEVISMSSDSLSKIRARGGNDSFTTVGEIVPVVLKDILTRHEHQGFKGLSTGFVDLDKRIGGFSAGQLIIVAGRPAMGKSILGMNIAEKVAKQYGHVLVISLEMHKQELIERSIVTESGVSANNVKFGRLDTKQRLQVENASREVKALPITIDDTGGLNISQLRAKAKVLHLQKPLQLIVIDYLQLLTGANKQNREQEVAGISRQLKQLAKELEIPIIALSQLNRGLESRTDKRPMLSDLRESGAIEQDADTVMFVYRDEVYKKDENSPAKGKAELIVAKQRSGPTGTVKLLFQGHLFRFVNQSYSNFPEGYQG